jgi:protein TonB
MVVSVAGQAVLITAAVVLPMLHPETVRRVMLVSVGPPAAYRPAKPQKIDPERQVPANRAAPVAFFQPAEVPRGLTTPPTALPEFSGPVGGSSIVGVPGGIGDPGGEGAGRLPEIAPPPPPKPAPQPARPVVKETPPSAQPQQIRRGGEVQASLLIYRPEPVYPPLARQARISGTVRLSAIINTEGRISQLRVLSGHPLLINAAMDAVRRWVYSPTLLNGVPVEVITEITVMFTLN